jgi:hypothetical protein
MWHNNQAGLAYSHLLLSCSSHLILARLCDRVEVLHLSHLLTKLAVTWWSDEMQKRAVARGICLKYINEFSSFVIWLNAWEWPRLSRWLLNSRYMWLVSLDSSRNFRSFPEIQDLLDKLKFTERIIQVKMWPDHVNAYNGHLYPRVEGGSKDTWSWLNELPIRPINSSLVAHDIG